MSAHQRQPRHTPNEDDDEEHTLLPGRDTDTDDDLDDLMKQLPDDTIRGALVEAGATKLLVNVFFLSPGQHTAFEAP